MSTYAIYIGEGDMDQEEVDFVQTGDAGPQPPTVTTVSEGFAACCHCERPDVHECEPGCEDDEIFDYDVRERALELAVSIAHGPYYSVYAPDAKIIINMAGEFYGFLIGD